jgi:hypothetical protein
MSIAWFGSKTGSIRIPGERNIECAGYPPRTCHCGCEESVRGKEFRFLPGYDARL